MKIKYKKTKSFDSLKELIEYDHLKDDHVDGLDKRDSHSSWKKDMFRKSETWKWFCRSLIEERKNCERCHGDGKDCSGLQVHHKHPDDYMNISHRDWFSVLCGRCHLKIEAFSRTDESRKSCPKEDRQFITVKPYIDNSKDVLSYQSGTRLINKIEKSLSIQKDPSRWINGDLIRKVSKEKADEAIEFMKKNRDLFR
jgi:hypothetical protein